MKDKFKISIAGTGTIAEKMASTVTRMEETELYAVGSRSLDRARAFGEKHGAEKCFGSYEELAADGGSDLIYVASPHSHHEPLARLFLENGRNVLCEKPMTVNKKQAEGLLCLAGEKKLFLSEGMWTRTLPAVKKMRELLDGGAIGTPFSLYASMGGDRRNDRRLTSPELAGGALLDMGIYLLTIASLVFGEEVDDMASTAVKSEKGVDAQNAVVLRFPGGKTAALLNSIVCPLDGDAMIFGDRGRMVLERFFACQKLTVLPVGGPEQTYEFPFEFTGFEYEVRACMAAIRSGKTECPEIPHRETLRILGLMDSLREQWGVRYPFEKTTL